MHGEKHTKVTGSNVKAAKKDDKDHIDYLKRDINYDAKNGGSNSQMTADEQHITNLARDIKYDDKIKPVAAMYGKSKGPKMESNAQVDKNLFKDMPIDSRASKGSPAMNLNKGYGKPMASPMKMAGSWMSKHTKSKM